MYCVWITIRVCIVYVLPLGYVLCIDYIKSTCISSLFMMARVHQHPHNKHSLSLLFLLMSTCSVVFGSSVHLISLNYVQAL